MKLPSRAPRWLAAAAIALAGTAHTQTPVAAEEPTAHRAAPASGPGAAATLSEGEVRKIDRDQGKLTVRHGAIPNLDMAPMTMVFRVADPRMLESLREGDRIRFSAERVGGAITVTRIEAVAR